MDYEYLVMPWTSVLGTTVEYPFTIAGLPVSKWTEKDKEWVHHYQRLMNLTINLDNNVVQLREEVKRLTHENNFMLKLIQRRDDE